MPRGQRRPARHRPARARHDDGVAGNPVGQVEVGGDLVGPVRAPVLPQLVRGDHRPVMERDRVQRVGRQQDRVQAAGRIPPGYAGRRVGERRDHVAVPLRQPPHQVQEVALAVGAAGQLPLPFRRQHLAKPVLGVDGAVVGERVGPEAERVRVRFAYGQALGGPSQVHEAKVAERLPGELVVVRLAARPGGRFPGRRLGARVPGHAPAVTVQVGQAGEGAEAFRAQEFGYGHGIARAVAKQTAHEGLLS
jgi:hypothetical protein